MHGEKELFRPIGQDVDSVLANRAKEPFARTRTGVALVSGKMGLMARCCSGLLQVVGGMKAVQIIGKEKAVHVDAMKMVGSPGSRIHLEMVCDVCVLVPLASWPKSPNKGGDCDGPESGGREDSDWLGTAPRVQNPHP